MEDNRADAILVREALEEHGIEGELIVLEDGEKAMDFVQALDGGSGDECPNLVILDLNLPKKSGRDVLRAIRLSEKCGRVPVVILSSSDTQQDKSDAAQLGANQYLRKPLGLEEFIGLGSTFRALLHIRS